MFEGEAAGNHAWGGEETAYTLLQAPPEPESPPAPDLASWKQQDYAQMAHAQEVAQAAPEPQRRGVWGWLKEKVGRPAQQEWERIKSRGQRAGEWVQKKIVRPVQQAVPKVMKWVDRHQREIVIGLGIAAGVAAVILSGGAATPLVAAAWVAGSAAVAGGVAALGTVGLNAYFGRSLGDNVLGNLGYAAGAAALTATAGFVLQAVAPVVTRTVASFCLNHVAVCSTMAPAFKAIDYGWTTYDVWQSQRTLSNPNAEAGEKILAAVNIGLAAWSEGLEPDEVLAVGLPLDDVVRKELLAKFAEVLEKEGKEAAFDYLRKVLGDVPVTRLGLLEDEVLEFAAGQGPDAIKALTSGWTDDQLRRFGRELALRAERDASAIAAAEELVQLGSIEDLSHLTPKQQELLEEMARNSMQYAENGQVVIGAWRGLDDGYIAAARESGAAYYHNHPEVWEILKGGLGKEKASEVAWQINQKALQPYIEKGVPFEYTLRGIPVRGLKMEQDVIELIWQGKKESEIIEILELKGGFKARWRELMELYRAGYQKRFDEAANAYRLVKP